MIRPWDSCASHLFGPHAGSYAEGELAHEPWENFQAKYFKHFSKFGQP